MRQLPLPLLILLLAGCHRAEGAGAPTEGFQDGLVHQVALSDPPIPTSAGRLDRMGRTPPTPTPEPALAVPAPEPEIQAPPPTPEPTPAPLLDAAGNPVLDAAGNPLPAPTLGPEQELAARVEAERLAQEGREAEILAGSPLAATPSVAPAAPAEPVAAVDAAAPAPAPEPPVALVVPAEILPPAPESDVEALGALSVAASNAVLPPELPPVGAMERCVELPPLEVLRIDQLRLIRTWPVDGQLRAELELPDGLLATVGVGDRVGPDGGRVVRIDRRAVVVGEVGFDLAGEAQLYARTIRMPE